MARTITTTVKLEEVYFDEQLYPRSHYDWRTVYDYSESMKAGAKFPPIILALLNGKKYLVDGKHRFEASKNLKLKSIKAIVYTGWNKDRIFKESVRANITHGRSLSPYEKRRIALRLMEMKCQKAEISDLICVSEDKLENFVAQRLVNTLTGEPVDYQEVEETAREIGRAILKSGVKQFAGKVLDDGDFSYIKDTQKNINISSQYNLLEQVVYLLKKNLIDKENKKVMILLKQLKKLLKDY